MGDLTPDQKLQVALHDKFHASTINDPRIRATFIRLMTGKVEGKITDAEMNSVHRFVTAVDYMIAALGYGVCDMYAEGGPVHLNESKFAKDYGNQSADDAPSPQ